MYFCFTVSQLLRVLITACISWFISRNHWAGDTVLQFLGCYLCDISILVQFHRLNEICTVKKDIVIIVGVSIIYHVKTVRKTIFKNQTGKKQAIFLMRACVFLHVAFTDRESLSNILTSFIASSSFCSSVIPSIGSGCSSSTAPVTGFIL